MSEAKRPCEERSTLKSGAKVTPGMRTDQASSCGLPIEAANRQYNSRPARRTYSTHGVIWIDREHGSDYGSAPSIAAGEGKKELLCYLLD